MSHGGDEAAFGGGCTEFIHALNYVAHRCPSAAVFTCMRKGASKHDLELMENDVLKAVFNCFGSVELCAIDFSWKQPEEYTLHKEMFVAHGDVPPSSHHPYNNISRDKMCWEHLGSPPPGAAIPMAPSLSVTC